ncbi:MAG TPA: tetraacyldisaccharide 4'-kinase [Longimicrobiales bacterium]|nr:tetraacyldisaccharide 4'-kinase [Longimicrobiales bacterium]
MSGRMAGLARRWWAGELGVAGTALDVTLAPAEAAYRMGIKLRNRAYDRRMLASTVAPLPVISIGNIAVGGTGKTPFTSWLALRLAQRGERPAIVHGGYAQDEPELHRTWAPEIPVFVDRDRVRAAGRAHAEGASVVLLDDAFQHRRIRRDLDIVLISVERWSDTVRLLPRGAWREPPAALERADVLVCVRKTATVEEAVSVARAVASGSGRPVLRVHLRAAGWQRDGVPAAAPTGPCLLVAGLADPGLFVMNARDAGALVTTELLFPDHHEYDDADAARIRAAAAGRTIITSAKDWVKLRGRVDAAETLVLTQEVVIEEGEPQLDAALGRVLR